MRLEWLEDILAVLDTGSFSAAAEIRHLSPSAFTRRIKTIEESMACELFDRSKKPIVLHRHALNCSDDLRNAVATLKQLKMQLSTPDADSRSQVTLYCQHILTTSLAPRLVELAAQNRDFSIRIRSGSKNDCLLALIKRETQFALMYEELDEQPGPATQSSEHLLLRHEKFIPVAKLKNNPALEKKIAARTIPVISYPASVYLGEVQKRITLSQLAPDIRLNTVAETGLALAVKEFVKRGFAVGWMPESIISDELKSGALSDLSAVLPSCELKVNLTRLSDMQADSAEEFWSVMQDNILQIVESGE